MLLISCSERLITATIMKRIIILLFTLMLCSISIDGQLEEGDRCDTRSTEPGICTKISQCRSIENAISQGKVNHVVCGFSGNWQIVCCPSTIISTTTMRTATERLATTTRIPTTKAIEQRISTGISVRKCNEYKDFAYNTHFHARLFGQPAQERKTSNCAFTSTGLIVGGTIARQREFPHMALIGYENGNSIHWGCGGTLISEQFVLSAAHCYDTQDYGQAKYVRLGEHDRSRTEGSEIDLQIIESFPHPEYQYWQKYDDIVLFKLDQKIDLNGTIRPACLPEQSYVPTRRAIVTGWGQVDWRGEDSNVLQKVTLEWFSQSECSRKYRSNWQLDRGILEETQICAGSHRHRMDSCQGDSGGPIQIYHTTHNCTYTVVGVTAFGKACGNIGIPGVYTRVYPYLSWIENIVWPGE